MKRAIRTGIFVAAAIALTWPLAAHLAGRLPLGSEGSATVPLFNLWTLRWNADRLLHGYAGYWDAPIFYPASGTFALSDPQPLTGLAFSPIYFLLGDGVPAYNLLLLLIFTLNGWGGYRLARALGVAETPAIMAGMLVESLPFIGHESGVLQLTALFPAPLAIAALVRFADDRQLRDAAGIGLWTTAAFLTSAYYGLFLLPLLLIGGLVLLNRSLASRRVAMGAGLAMLLAAATLAPVLVSQARLTSGFARLPGTIRRSSALPQDYLPPAISINGSGQPLFPGAGLVFLGLAGAGLGWRAGARKEVVFFVLMGACAGLLSLGLNLEIAGRQPYEWIRTTVPGYAQLRSPFRAAVFTQLPLAALGGYALAWLSSRPGWLRPVLAGLIVLSAAAENASLPIRLAPAPERPAWAVWLAGQPDAPVLLVPFPTSGRTADFAPTVEVMLLALDIGKPLVNGYSGFFPDEYRSLAELMNAFPIDPAFDRLSALAPVYLVIDAAWLAESEGAGRLAAEPGLRTIYEDGEVRLEILLPEMAEVPPD